MSGVAKCKDANKRQGNGWKQSEKLAVAPDARPVQVQILPPLIYFTDDPNQWRKTSNTSGDPVSLL